MITVHGFSPSGNCHKLRLLLEMLGRDYRWIETDSAHGATRTPEYLAKNPNGRVPMLELDDGRILVESNAILCWLADGTHYLPSDPWQRAQALSWMFFEQYSHEPCIAVARFIRGWSAPDSPRRGDELTRCQARGHDALAVMERHLSAHRWFTGEEFGIADIALFAYTDVAHHGGFDLAACPSVRDWLASVRALPGFVAMAEPSADVLARMTSAP